MNINLRDIHLPINPWWLMPVIYITALILLGAILYAFTKYKKYKKYAINLLTQVEKDYLTNKITSNIACAQISEILKRTACIYYPNQSVTTLFGKDWIDFLTKTAPKLKANNLYTYFCIKAYQRYDQDQDQTQTQQKNLENIFKFAKKWIKTRRRIC